MINFNDKSISSVYDGITKISKIMKGDLLVYKTSSFAPLLPSEYQQVEYIESDSTRPKINTGVNTYNYNKIRIENKFITTGGYIEKSYRQAGFVYVDHNGSGYSYVSLYHDVYYERADLHGDLNFATYRYNTSGFLSNTPYQLNEMVTTDLTYTTTKVEGTINDESINLSISGTKRTNANIYLFDMYRTSIWAHIARLYYTKIYADDELVRDFIPCYRKSDNVAGLYDLVNNTFYTSVSSGTFLKGKDIK